MGVPQFARYLAALFGASIVIATATSVIGTVITPRPATSRLTRWIDWLVDLCFRAPTRRTASCLRRDGIIATQAPTLLLCQLIS
jgi:hypothetical protein